MTIRPGPHDVYWHARQEHMFLLRAEGLSLRQIGCRMGISKATVSLMIGKAASRINHAMRRTRFRYESAISQPQPLPEG